MRATVMYGAGDVRIENVPDARIIEPTDVGRSGQPGLYLRQRFMAVSRNWKRSLTAAVAWDMRRSASSKRLATKFAR